MRNWKRIMAAVGTAALLISNMGSISQAVMATEDTTWEQTPVEPAAEQDAPAPEAEEAEEADVAGDSTDTEDPADVDTDTTADGDAVNPDDADVPAEGADGETDADDADADEDLADDEEVVEDTDADDAADDAETVTYKADSLHIDVEDSDAEITVAYDADAEIPEGVSLAAYELTGDEAAEYEQRAAEELGTEITASRFFDVHILDADGNVVQPKTPVTITITYDEPLEVAAGQEIQQVHFKEETTDAADTADAASNDSISMADLYEDNSASDTTEVIEVLDVKTEGEGDFVRTVSFEQSSFSVSGTIMLADRGGPGGSSTSGTFKHIELECAATATIVLNGKTYTQDITLSTSNVNKNNTTMTATQGGSAYTGFSFNSVVAGNGANGPNGTTVPTVECSGSYPTGTKSNPVYYTIEVTVPVTFKDDDGNVILTTDVTLSVTTNYWDENNDCPGLDMGKSNWKNGYFVGSMSGIDIPITGNVLNKGTVMSLAKTISGTTFTDNQDYTIYIYKYSDVTEAEDGSITVKSGASPVYTWNAKVEAGKTTDIQMNIVLDYGTYVVVEDANSENDREGYKHTGTAVSVVMFSSSSSNGTTGSNPFTLDATNYSCAITVENSYKKAAKQLTLQKVDQTGTELSDATFTLTKTVDGTTYWYDSESADWNTTKTTISLGSLSVSLGTGTYTLTETKAPSGYELLEAPIRIVVTTDAVTLGSNTDTEVANITGSDGNYVLTVTNESGARLPETGGRGTLPITLAGMGLMAIAFIGYSKRRWL